MKISKVLMAFSLAIAVLISQIGVVSAAPTNEPTLLTGMVTAITLETDINTAVTTVLVTIVDENNISQTIRLSLETAKDKKLRLIIADENGIPQINPAALGTTIQINPKTVISDDEADLHPVGDALATLFSEVTDYKTIMAAHADGYGFGVIAQALWLTLKLEGDPETIFFAILKAKETGDFSYFAIINEDGTTTTPKNWGQFRKAILDGEKKGALGVIMSDKNKDNNVAGQGNNNDNGNKDKDKDNNKDKGNNGDEKGNNDKDKGRGNNK